MGDLLHVDDFIDDVGDVPADEPHLRYAQWFLHCYRLPALAKMQFRPFLPSTLFCTYDAQRYRVTGCSRLGDVWLTTDFQQETGYEKRVDVAKCSQWSPAP